MRSVTDADRKAVLKERDRRRLLRGGIGLYTYQQERNTTPFQFAAQIVVGLIVALIGLLLVWGVWQTRRQEISAYGRADSHFGSFAFSVALVMVGVFMGHAGIIFYWKRFKARQSEPK